MLDFLFAVPVLLAEFLFNLGTWAAIFYYGFIFSKDTWYKYKDGYYDDYFKS